MRPVLAAAAMIAACWLLDRLGISTLWRLGAAAAVYIAIAGRCWVELQQSALERLPAVVSTNRDAASAQHQGGAAAPVGVESEAARA